MAVLTLAEGVARGLSFGFYLLAAHALAPASFGVVQFTIALATVALAPVQLVGIAIRRELGADRGDREATLDTLGSGLAVSVGALAVTLTLSGLVIAVGLAETANVTGLLAVIAGLTAFEIYYSIARGRADFRRAAFAYAAGAALQLVVFGIVTATTDPSPTAALCIFGASSLAPILVYEAWRPLLRRRSLRIRRQSLEKLWAIGAPLAPGTVAFLVWNSADQIWVGNVFGSFDIGIYGAARNLAQIVMVPIVGFTGALVPRVAELRTSKDRDRAVRLISWTTWVLVASCAAIALVLIFGRTFLLETFYGDAYGAGANALIGLSVGMVAFGGFSALGHGSMGWGAPRVYSMGYGVAAVVEVVLLVAGDWNRPYAAAWIFAGSIALGWAAMALYLRFRPLALDEDASEPPQDEPPGPPTAS
jgi:O-antigen/teichoic acid export membrane protein